MQHFRVVALGLPTSGKSIYLSTLHHELINNLAPGVVLSVPLRERKRLTKIYQLACDPGVNSWPDANRSNERMHESLFTCRVAARNKGHIDLLQFTYVDYAGEWLTEPSEGSSLDRALEEQLERANVLLGIIDGRRLLEYFDGGTSSAVYFDTWIRPVAEHMRAFSGPIHFLISKWDLLQDHYTLAEVRGRLFDSPHATWLRELIENRVEHHGLRRRRVGTVRLIPVSSMGDFAYLDDDGLIKKDPGKRPKPLNVEIPLVAVIPDLVMMALAASDEARGSAKAAGGEAGAHAATIKSASEAADSMLRDGSSGTGRTPAAPAPTAPAPGGGHGGGLLSTDSGIRLAAMVAVMIGAPIGKSLGKAGARAARKTRRRYRRHRATERNRVKNYESGLFYAMHNFTERLKSFDENHPDSLLS